MTPTANPTPRIGARVLLLDSDDRILLVHARDPDDPDHHWWELPGGGQQPGEQLQDTVRREVGEETGIVLTDIGPELWIRESRFTYRGRAHHRLDHVYLGRVPDGQAELPLNLSDNEKTGLIERRWWTADDLGRCTDKLLPAELPELLATLLAGRWTHDEPLNLKG
jgi:8-oxo-dGTP pyrophosphatase MutT (NUDIX family)